MGQSALVWRLTYQKLAFQRSSKHQHNWLPKLVFDPPGLGPSHDGWSLRGCAPGLGVGSSYWLVWQNEGVLMLSDASAAQQEVCDPCEELAIGCTPSGIRSYQVAAAARHQRLGSIGSLGMGHWAITRSESKTIRIDGTTIMPSALGSWTSPTAQVDEEHDNLLTHWNVWQSV